MEPPSLEVGGSSFLLNTVCFKRPEEPAIKTPGKVVVCIGGRKEEFSIVLRVDP